MAILEEEVRTMFATHPESLRALRLSLDTMRAGSTSQQGEAVVAAFEELLEALTIRHGLWGEGG